MVKRKFPFTIVSVLILGIFQAQQIQYAHAGCSPMLKESSVARMCYDSVASGREIYIDTSGAKSTYNVKGASCHCTGTIIGMKAIDINIKSSSKMCGSTIEFHSEQKLDFQFTTMDTNCLETNMTIAVPANITTNYTVKLLKQTEPYEADFCTKIAIRTCPEGVFQCNDGTCGGWEPAKLCDNFPQCDDGSDEINCNTMVCPEGMTNCKIESPNITVIEPVVRIQCYESSDFITTSTTSTTTTTTTTTTPSTTTSSSTTAETTTEMATTTTTAVPTTTTITETSTTTQASTTTTVQPETTTQELITVPSSGTTTDDDSSVVGVSNEVGNTEKGQTDIIETIKKPYVIAGIIAGAVLLGGLTCLIIWAVRRRRKRSKSQDLAPTDLWIQNNQHELEPLDS